MYIADIVRVMVKGNCLFLYDLYVNPADYEKENSEWFSRSFKMDRSIKQVGQLLLKYIKKAQMSFPLSLTYTLTR